MINVTLPSRRKTLHIAGFIVLVALVLPFIVFAVPQLVLAEYSFVVLSDSMEPAIGAGDVVIVNSVPPDAVEDGDIITYERRTNSIVTHRVVDVQESNQGMEFRTKGDANENADPGTVDESQVLGKVMFSIPLLGYVVSFASTKQGLLLLVIVPGFLLVATELWDLFRASRVKEDTAPEDGAGEGD